MKRPLFALLALLLPAAARAQDCGNLQLVNSVQMIRGGGGRDLVPVSINGAKRNFLFDTGGSWTSVSKDLATELHLPVATSDFHLHDMGGNISSDRAKVQEFLIGRLRLRNASLPALSPSRADGLYGLDYMLDYDVDVDFGTDRLNYFSQKHCPGKIQYWKADAMAEIAIGREGIRENRLLVPVTLDGHEFDALIDTGASNSVLRADIAQKIFGIMPGGPDAPRTGIANGDANLPVYSHRFKSLTFDGIAVANPLLSIIADAMAQKDTLFEHPVHAPDLVVGMDVLRKLHIYLAFGEMKMYVTPASGPPDGSAQGPR